MPPTLDTGSARLNLPVDTAEFVSDFLDFAEHRREAEVARFIEALDYVLFDVYRGIRLVREVGSTMGSVGRWSRERTTRPRLADPAGTLTRRFGPTSR